MTDEAETAAEVAATLRHAVAEAFRAFTTASQQERDDPLALTMSGLGGCSRQAAYRLAKVPPSEKLTYEQNREANIGTMIHAGLLPHLAPLLDGVEEIRVTLTVGDLVINGRSDLYSEKHGLVSDLKTVGPYKMAAIGNTPVPAHRIQVAGYAWAAAQSGRPVDWIAWLYLDRASGADHIIVEPFDDDVIKMVTLRCEELAAYAESPDSAPRDERGPGLSIVCDQCPWLRECWGEDAVAGEVGAQRILAHDNAGVADAIRLYDEARARERQANSDKEFARAMFSAYKPGVYGDYQFYWSSAGESVDKDAALKLLEDAGIPIPRKKGSRRLIVKRTHQGQEN